MVIAATIVWVIGMVCLFVGFITFTIEELPHEDEPFKRYYDSWGGVRFYTLTFFVVIFGIALWPIALLALWITALIKGW